jgi:competence protein ComEC
MTAFLPFLFGAALFPMSRFFPLAAAFSFFVAAALLVKRKKYPALAIVIFGFLYAFSRFSPAAESPDVWNKDLMLTGSFAPKISAASSGVGAQKFVVQNAFDGDSGIEIKELRNEDMTIFTDYAYDADKEYEILLKTGSERLRRNPGWQLDPGLYGSIKAVSAERDAPFSFRNFFDRQRKRLNAYVLGRLQGDSAALVASVTTGDRSYLGDDLKEAFNVTGLSHILSISGTHFGLFSAMMFGIFVFLIKRLPYRILLRPGGDDFNCADNDLLPGHIRFRSPGCQIVYLDQPVSHRSSPR